MSSWSQYRDFLFNSWRMPQDPTPTIKPKTADKLIAKLKQQLSESDRRLTEALRGHLPQLQEANQLRKQVSDQGRKINQLMDEIKELKKQLQKGP